MNDPAYSNANPFIPTADPGLTREPTQIAAPTCPFCEAGSSTGKNSTHPQGTMSLPMRLFLLLLALTFFIVVYAIFLPFGYAMSSTANWTRASEIVNWTETSEIIAALLFGGFLLGLSALALYWAITGPRGGLYFTTSCYPICKGCRSKVVSFLGPIPVMNPVTRFFLLIPALLFFGFGRMLATALPEAEQTLILTLFAFISFAMSALTLYWVLDGSITAIYLNKERVALPVRYLLSALKMLGKLLIAYVIVDSLIGDWIWPACEWVWKVASPWST